MKSDNRHALSTWTYLLPTSDTFIGVAPEAETENRDLNKDSSISEYVDVEAEGNIDVQLSAEREPPPSNRGEVPGHIRYTRVLPLKLEINSSQSGTLNLNLKTLYTFTAETAVQMWLFNSEKPCSILGTIYLVTDRQHVKLTNDSLCPRWNLLEAPLTNLVAGEIIKGLQVEIKNPGNATLYLDALRVGKSQEYKPPVEPVVDNGRLEISPKEVEQDDEKVTLTFTPRNRLGRGSMLKLYPPALWHMQTEQPDEQFYVKTSIQGKQGSEAVKCVIEPVDFCRWQIKVSLENGLACEQSLHFVISKPVWTQKNMAGQKSFRLYVKESGSRQEYLLRNRPLLHVKPFNPTSIKAILASPGRPDQDNAPRLKIVSTDKKGNRSPGIESPFSASFAAYNTDYADYEMLELARHNDIFLENGFFEGHPSSNTASVTAPYILKARVSNQQKNEAVTESNPLFVEASGEYLPYFGYLHTHSDISNDGRENIDFGYQEAIYNAGLDFAAVSDHFWADKPSWQWEQVLEAACKHNREGQFVTFPGYEWSSQDFGDRNVYFKNVGPQCPVGVLENTPAEIFAHLRGEEALVIPHSPAYELRARGIYWDYHDPDFERLVEIFSSHGSSETVHDNPYPLKNTTMYPAVEYNTVQAAIKRGVKIGFIAGGDNHRRPLPEDPARGNTGITGTWARELTRDGIWEALFARRCFGTTGVRATVGFKLQGHWMGETVVNAGKGMNREMQLRIASPIPVQSVEILKNNQLLKKWCPENRRCFVFTTEYADKLTEGTSSTDFYYVRARLGDDQMAWSSPVWVET
ncbi:MAG: DUF3604 domain-containing protein [Verrucomicrobiota bacterium]